MPHISTNRPLLCITNFTEPPLTSYCFRGSSPSPCLRLALLALRALALASRTSSQSQRNIPRGHVGYHGISDTTYRSSLQSPDTVLTIVALVSLTFPSSLFFSFEQSLATSWKADGGTRAPSVGLARPLGRRLQCTDSRRQVWGWRTRSSLEQRKGGLWPAHLGPFHPLHMAQYGFRHRGDQEVHLRSNPGYASAQKQLDRAVANAQCEMGTA
jgi:hypothetical protein